MARLEERPPAPTLDHPAVRIAIVCSGFHRGITEALLDGAHERLSAAGLSEGHLDIRWVPGAYEAPFAAKTLARTGRYAGIIALGAVVRGATAHFDHVCYAASQGLIQVSLDTGVPCTFGILTCDTAAQAWERAGGAVGNAGGDAADAVVSLINLAAAVRAG
ncbi:MAG: 6,7-dimethyl-8-ribityllumazine synthase [Actinobacteria bacterium]|nr:6,7-dimethyl-8-ribityllumazine synthase [Thermoleophilia bacterium]MCB9010834.1 6,7-dimethyl-8-ribityllumazine synthase [Actinomycetota bacterium]